MVCFGTGVNKKEPFLRIFKERGERILTELETLVTKGAALVWGPGLLVVLRGRAVVYGRQRLFPSAPRGRYFPRGTPLSLPDKGGPRPDAV
jgi:hypothetical protein